MKEPLGSSYKNKQIILNCYVFFPSNISNKFKKIQKKIVINSKKNKGLRHLRLV